MSPLIESHRDRCVEQSEFVSEMQRGQEAPRRRDLSAACRHFDRAHRMGHANFPQHLAVHRALLLVAWKCGSLRRVAAELSFIAALVLLRPLL